VLDDKGSGALDIGTRQWTPDDDLQSASQILKRRLDAQRARRSALLQDLPVRGANARLELDGSPQYDYRISLSYPELLKVLKLAAVDQCGVTLTRAVDNLYLQLEDASKPDRFSDRVAALTALELAVRDRLEASVARRYLDLCGADHDPWEEADSGSPDRASERTGG